MKTSILPVYSLLLTRLIHSNIQLSRHLCIVAIKNVWHCRKNKTCENNNNITTTHWETAICQNFTNIVLFKYNSAMKLFYRQRSGGLENLSHFFITVKWASSQVRAWGVVCLFNRCCFLALYIELLHIK